MALMNQSDLKNGVSASRHGRGSFGNYVTVKVCSKPVYCHIFAGDANFKRAEGYE
jgi:hypothetical protein